MLYMVQVTRPCRFAMAGRAAIHFLRMQDTLLPHILYCPTSFRRFRSAMHSRIHSLTGLQNIIWQTYCMPLNNCFSDHSSISAMQRSSNLRSRQHASFIPFTHTSDSDMFFSVFSPVPHKMNRLLHFVSHKNVRTWTGQ